MPLSQLPSDELLARYFSGEASPSDRAEVEAWVGSSAERRALLDSLRGAWNARGPGRAWNVDAAWQRVAPQLDATAPAGRRPRRHRGASPARWTASPLLRLAAVLAIVAGVSLVWPALRPSPAERVTYATAAAEQRVVDLPDGTRVTLAPQSALQVPVDFARNTYRVDLTGEAVFEVPHDESRVFEVRAAGAITRDLGTVFSVRARIGDSAVRVVLVEGSASLRPLGAEPARGVTLNAREVGTLAAGATTVRVDRDVDVAALVAWRGGTLEFIDAPFRDVAAELERWYGVRVRLADPAIGARRVSAPLPAGNLADAIDVLQRVLGVRLDRMGDTLVVR